MHFYEKHLDLVRAESCGRKVVNLIASMCFYRTDVTLAPFMSSNNGQTVMMTFMANWITYGYARVMYINNDAFTFVSSSVTHDGWSKVNRSRIQL